MTVFLGAPAAAQVVGKLESSCREIRSLSSSIVARKNRNRAASPPPPSRRRRRGPPMGSAEAQAAVADADDDLARRVAQVELDAKAAEVAAPALATMDGSLHTLPSKPAAGLDDMDGSLYNLPAFG